jgi:hypothetical protein
MHQTLYIDVDEEVNSIINRIRKSLAKYNILVITQGALIMQSTVSLKLIKKEADSLGKKIMIITKDELAASIAKKIGFAVKSSLDDLKDVASDNDVVLRSPSSQVKIENKIDNSRHTNIEGILNKNNRLGNLGSDSFVSRDKKFSGGHESVKDFQNTEKERYPEINKLENPVRVVNNNKDSSLDEDESFKHLFNNSPKKESVPNKAIDKKAGAGFFWFLVLILVILFLGIVGYFYLPKAEVVVFPKQEEQFLNLKLEVSENANMNVEGVINLKPRLIENENILSLSFPATGQKNSSSQKAKGKITIYNEFSETSQVLVSTTRFLSNGDKLFRLTNTVTVPGMVIKDGKVEPGIIEAEIIADEPGEAYNIKEADFKIPGFKGSSKYEKFYAKLNQETKGGGGGEGELKTVSGSDIESAKIKTENELKKQLKDKIKSNLAEGDNFLEEAVSFEVLDYSVFPEEDSVTENFEYQVKIKIKALAFSNKELDQKIDNFVRGKLSQKNISLEPITVNKEFSGMDIDFAKKTIKTEMKIKVNAKANIDKEKIKNYLVGKNKNEITDIIEVFPEINKIEAAINPSFISNSFPRYPSRIEIKIEELSN